MTENIEQFLIELTALQMKYAELSECTPVRDLHEDKVAGIAMSAVFRDICQELTHLIYSNDLNINNDVIKERVATSFRTLQKDVEDRLNEGYYFG
jgi:hypothetical protein